MLYCTCVAPRRSALAVVLRVETYLCSLFPQSLFPQSLFRRVETSLSVPAARTSSVYNIIKLH